MRFEYLQRVIVDAELEVDNIGDVVIQANNDLAEEFYLIIKTELGWVEVIESGPIVPDLNLLPLNYNIKYSRFEYNQSKIERIIDKFLNDSKRIITQAKIVELEDIADNIVNPLTKMFPNAGGLEDD